MKRFICVLAILALSVLPVLAAPIVFLAPSDYDVANLGAPGTDPLVIERFPGETVVIGAFVYDPENTYTFNGMDLAVMATEGAGAFGTATAGEVGTPIFEGPAPGLPANFSHFGGTYSVGTTGSRAYAYFTYTIDESVAMGSSIDVTWVDEITSGLAPAYLSNDMGTSQLNAAGTGNLAGSFQNLRISVVPEPATLALLGIGLATLVGYRRKRS